MVCVKQTLDHLNNKHLLDREPYVATSRIALRVSIILALPFMSA